MSGDHTFREVGPVPFSGGVAEMEMHDDMKVLYSSNPCFSCVFFPFSSLFFSQVAVLYNLQIWADIHRGSLLHPFLLAFQHVCGFR